MWHPDIPDQYKNQILTGDMYELCKAIPDNSIDIIFTDPPYPEKFRYTYDQLAEVAARVLKPGAPCFVYSGNDGIPYVVSTLSRHLKYRATISLNHKEANMVWQSRFIAGWKPIFVYHKGDWAKDAPIIFGKISPQSSDKRYHEWGQSCEEPLHYIRYHSKPGDVVLEPFCGGGATIEAAVKLGRNFIAMELVPKTANIARRRINTVASGVYMEQMELPVVEQLSFLTEFEEVVNG